MITSYFAVLGLNAELIFLFQGLKMTILTLGFGQCGNQVLNSLFQYIYEDVKYYDRPGYPKQFHNEDYENEALNKWFRVSKTGKLFTRSILVDSECKVIDSINNNPSFTYQRKVMKPIGGASNNWAHGYSEVAANLVDDVMCEIRKELEYCDQTPGFLSLQSSSGGTGSGVGSYVLERIRDEYPTKPISCGLVLPYEHGELVTQHYNTILTLRKLYDACDVCFLFQNEQLQGLIERVLKQNKIDFADLNKLIAQKIASVFQPAGDNQMWNIVDHVVPHAGYKLAHIKCSPYTSRLSMRYETGLKWTELIVHAKQMLRASTNFDWEAKYASSSVRAGANDYLKVLSNLLITRGKCEQSGIKITSLEDKSFYVNWIPVESRLKHFHQNRPLYGEPRNMTLVTNNSSMYRDIEKIVDQAWNMFSYNASIHQYAKYGIEKMDFDETFIKVENIIKNYKSLNTASSS